jgi:hypothetical protein
LVACQGHGDSAAPPNPRHDAPRAVADAASTGSGSSGSAAGSGETDDGSLLAKPDEPDPVDPGKAIADLGAIPAWQSVVDRAQYLARRGQHGVVFGTIGPEILVPGPPPPAPLPDAGAAKPPDAGLVPSPYVWLVDDTEGNGALAIRVALGARSDKVRQGDRVALGGAWALDDDRKWFWKVDAISPLPAATPTGIKDPPAAPGHTIVNGDLAQGARTISLAKEGDAAYFQVTGAPPAIDGDGWPVADELGNPVYALLNMPGERASYGAQDLRTPDERWQLKRGQTYWVRIGPVHKHGPDKPATINAKTAPVRVK